MHEPENVFKTAAMLVKPFAVEIPLLVVVIAIWPGQDNGKATKQLAAFWRGMNQFRERWHSLSAQVLFLLSPIAYKHLSLNADHLKRWISLKLRLWEGSTDLEVLARPGMEANTPPPLRINVPSTDNENVSAPSINGSNPTASEKFFLTRQILGFQGPQLEKAIRRGESKSDQVKRYYLPMIAESLAMGDRQGAKNLREEIGGLEGLGQEECEALKKLDGQLAEPTNTHRFDVFISYRKRDRDTVRKLLSALRKRGLKVWWEEEQILSGISWQTVLGAGLRDSASIAVLIGKDGLGTWQLREIQAVLREIARYKLPIIPVLLPDAPKNLTLPPFLANRSWVDLRQGITEAKIDQLVWGITGKKPSVSA
ncbi:MAG: toll/interleukin-1 receptor domain-containing protein [Proteobacteria bacterium]|nr:toll/interleukin-1 receptor domain-containing protein [Pseudomonadota bacterium]